MYQEKNKNNYFELNKFIFCFNKNIISIIKNSYNEKKYNTYYSFFEDDNHLFENKKYDKQITFLGFKLDKYREFIFPEKNINLILNEKNTFIPDCFFIDKRINQGRIENNNKSYYSDVCNFIILKNDIVNIDFKFTISNELEETQLLSVLDQSLTFAKYDKIDSEIYLEYNDNNKISVYCKNTYINKYNIKF